MVGFSGMGNLGGNNQLLSKLGIEVGKLNAEFENMQAPLNDLLKSFQEAAQPGLGALAGGGPVPAASPGNFFGSGRFLTAVIRLAYITVLKEAIDKATNSKVFNLETAINDLWVHLEAIKRVGASPTAGVGSVNAAIEISKLRGMIMKREQMFQILSDIIRKYSETARSITSNLR